MKTTHESMIPAGGVELPADLIVPEGAGGIVLFAHGSGSSRMSPRNRAVAEALRRDGGFATLLFDLLTPAEDELYANRFEIGLLTERLLAAIDHIAALPETKSLPVGLFGASTGAAAALAAAAHADRDVRAVVSRGGRPDLAGEALQRVKAATLLIVGGNDDVVIDLNRQALVRIAAPEKDLVIVPGATHLFEEPGTLQQVMRLATAWFVEHLR